MGKKREPASPQKLIMIVIEVSLNSEKMLLVFSHVHIGRSVCRTVTRSICQIVTLSSSGVNGQYEHFCPLKPLIRRGHAATKKTSFKAWIHRCPSPSKRELVCRVFGLVSLGQMLTTAEIVVPMDWTTQKKSNLSSGRLRKPPTSVD